MRVEDVISAVNTMQPNTLDDRDKYSMLSNAERCVREVLSGYVGYEGCSEPMEDFDPERDNTATLLTPAPYSELYKYYLLAEINLRYGDIAKYNTYSTLYETAFDNFRRYVVRNYQSKNTIRRFKTI